MTRFSLLMILPPAMLAATGAHAADPAMFVYKGAGCEGRDRIAAFETATGAKAAGAVDFLNQADWTELSKSARWAIPCWSKMPIQLALSIPMTVKGETSFADGLSGKHDAAFAEIGKLLVAAGKADAYLRIGWEFNGNWYPWAVQRDPTGFREYFRRIVGILRQTPGQKFQIVWNPSLATGSTPPDQAWPGDDSVDLVALDVYNQSWAALNTPASRWTANLKANYGLDWLASFAAAHNKPIAIPEWGTGTRPDGHGGGDDPLFIRNMAAWMRANNVRFAGYWDYNAGDYNALLSTGLYPQAGAAFREEFVRH